MHILVVNDDGPPSPQSPYVHSLVRALQHRNHTVSVVLPHSQCSYISKAHLVRQPITPTIYRPEPLQFRPRKNNVDDEEWILIDSTPASCVQIGLFHYFSERGSVDLIISGPNYGRNTTAVFVMGSGTVGGALEAALCGKKAVSLSYGFFDPELGHDEDTIDAASMLSAKLIEKLVDEWDADRVHLFNINVPLIKNVMTAKIVFTNVLQNKWTTGSCFKAVGVPKESMVLGEEAIELHREKRDNGSDEDTGNGQPMVDGTITDSPRSDTHKLFQFVPVPEAVEAPGESHSGHDGWAVKEGMVSVTPLRANFMHVNGMEGEIIL